MRAWRPGTSNTGPRSRASVRLGAVRVAVLIVVLLGALACGERITGPTDGSVTITGVVTSLPSRAPMSSTAVQFSTVLNVPVGSAVTDSNGRYSVTLPRTDDYLAIVNAAEVGRLRIRSGGVRGDLVVGNGFCVARYGVVTDEQSGTPIQGVRATLTGVEVNTGSDGWYMIDLGCPDSAPPPGGTTLTYFVRPGYRDAMQVAGRGVSGVRRDDIAMAKMQ